MPRPTLVVVSGPSGSGKTTLAHELARAIGCPAICRDEIKEGMVHAHGAFDRQIGDELTHATLPVFFEVLEFLLKAHVTVVAEAAFQERLWRPGLDRLAPFCTIKIVHCIVDGATAYTRRLERAEGNAIHAIHMDAASIRADPGAAQRHDDFVFPTFPGAPVIRVATRDGYEPTLAAIAASLSGKHPQS
jgi:predicted kinase